MWAQIIKTRLKAGRDDDFVELMGHFRMTEKAGSGLVRLMGEIFEGAVEFLNLDVVAEFSPKG